MAWNSALPAEKSLGSSAALRANFQAVEDSLCTQNWCGDPLLECWPAGDSAAPAFYVLSGTGAAISRGTSLYGLGGMHARVAYGSAPAVLSQVLCSSKFPTLFRAKTFVAAVAVSAATANQCRIALYDGIGRSYSSYHTGNGQWQWLTVVRQLDVAATGITIEGRVETAGDYGYFNAFTHLMGQIPPTRFVPTPERIVTHSPGLAGTLSVSTLCSIHHSSPAVLQEVSLEVGTAPTTQAVIVQVKTWDGSAWQGAFSTRPQVAAGATRGAALVDGTHRYRCALGAHGTTPTPTNTVQVATIDQVGSGTVGSDLRAFIHYKMWSRPQNPWLAMSE